MFARDPLSADRKRKEKESRMIVEGTTLYKQKKLREAIEKRDEHRKVTRYYNNVPSYVVVDVVWTHI